MRRGLPRFAAGSALARRASEGKAYYPRLRVGLVGYGDWYNGDMPQFTHHVFVCCNQRDPGSSRGCCDPSGNEKLRDAFKSEIKKRGLRPLVRANTSGCLDQCELGPTVVIYPQAI